MRILRNPHIQSALATLHLRARWVERNGSGIRAASRRIVLECEDGTKLVAEHATSRDPGKSKGIAILFHGWEGSSDSAYLVCLGRYLHRRGYEVFRVNFRDHGGTHELNPGIFHSCRLEEMVLAVKEAVRLGAGGPTHLVGFSLGGNFALRIANVASSYGISLARVVAVSPVIDPARCLEAIENAPWFYHERFIKRWTQSLRLKESAFPDLYPLDPLGPPSLRKRTDLLVERFTEFADSNEYLKGYSIAGDRLSGLSCPATILAAADDPIIPVDDLLELRRPDSLEIEIHRWGGHCGFIEDLRLRSWVERRVAAILAQQPPGNPEAPE